MPQAAGWVAMGTAEKDVFAQPSIFVRQDQYGNIRRVIDDLAGSIERS